VSPIALRLTAGHRDFDQTKANDFHSRRDTSPQALERLGVADIAYITVCLGLPIPPISREHGVRLIGLP
jgi:hypothetical protein